MRKLFEQYGIIIVVAIVIVALIATIMLVAPGDGTGWMEKSLHSLTTGFSDKVDNAQPGFGGAGGAGGGAGGAGDESNNEATSFTIVLGQAKPLGEGITMNTENGSTTFYRFSDATPSIEQLNGAKITIVEPDGVTTGSDTISIDNGLLTVVNENVYGIWENRFVVVTKDNLEFFGSTIPKKGIYTSDNWFYPEPGDGDIDMMVTIDWS